MPNTSNTERCESSLNNEVVERSRAERLQDSQEQVDSESGVMLDNFYAVKVVGESELNTIMECVSSYYVPVHGVHTEFTTQASAEEMRTILWHLRAWSNISEEYRVLNSEDEYYWMGIPWMGDELYDLLEERGWMPERFNYDKHIGRLYYCGDGSCGDEERCPTCIHREESS